MSHPEKCLAAIAHVRNLKAVQWEAAVEREQRGQGEQEVGWNDPLLEQVTNKQTNAGTHTCGIHTVNIMKHKEIPLSSK